MHINFRFFDKVLFFLVLFELEFILSFWTIRRQKKQALIEQMRTMGYPLLTENRGSLKLLRFSVFMFHGNFLKSPRFVTFQLVFLSNLSPARIFL